jgi:hypothetical protein
VGNIDPEGILNAWMMKVRMNKARRRAMIIASIFSRMADLGGFGEVSVTYVPASKGHRSKKIEPRLPDGTAKFKQVLSAAGGG